jgi:hypothetical protein
MPTFKFRNFIVLSNADAARYAQTAKLPPAWIYNLDELIAQAHNDLNYMLSKTETDEYDIPLYVEGCSSEVYNTTFNELMICSVAHLPLSAAEHQRVEQACRWAGYK